MLLALMQKITEVFMGEAGMKLVERKDDMSPDRSLVVCQRVDGDVSVQVFGKNGCGLSVEFCRGGNSPNTLKALGKLVNAIEKDNKERRV